MKPPKLYTSPSRPTRKRAQRKKSSPHRKTVNSPAISASREVAKSPRLSQRMDDIHSLSQQIRTYASKMDQWLSVVSNLTEAIRDKDALQNVLKALSEIKPVKKANSSNDSDPDSKNESNPVAKNQLPAPPKPFSKSGDSLYDLLNSPSLPALVDKVMSNKKNRR
ncbi:hypothetical protein [Marininema halotolerans]|uniref:Uncharacterized protein n=1 Tax=Marininema halotolerans TaxID=1155944 RepID=A0A1I6RQL0_9BACL|nr:hypothetical protein [Marininema halotolerans]SFS66975.1 hypothetical protein SAMN05444972_105295 [Marininema halotolerans]